MKLAVLLVLLVIGQTAFAIECHTIKGAQIACTKHILRKTTTQGDYKSIVSPQSIQLNVQKVDTLGSEKTECFYSYKKIIVNKATAASTVSTYVGKAYLKASTCSVQSGSSEVEVYHANLTEI